MGSCTSPHVNRLLSVVSVEYSKASNGCQIQSIDLSVTLSAFWTQSVFDRIDNFLSKASNAFLCCTVSFVYKVRLEWSRVQPTPCASSDSTVIKHVQPCFFFLLFFCQKQNEKTEKWILRYCIFITSADGPNRTSP
mmetsp:Transcript_548/g.974  ORF Transcript_548/g.974 Transcript_548/m.974 type:complete len:136 (+) Transcript_548:1538-1945(+)